MKNTFAFLLLSISAIAANAAVSNRGGRERVCAQSPGAEGPVDLSAGAREALLFQIEEERMARELYVALGEKWGARQFRRIPQAEQHHEEMLRALAERAGLEVPAAVPAKFASPVIQQRYDSLLARGMESAKEALAVGAAVERQDITDLEELIKATESAELRQLAEALKAASERHLAAFSGERRGGAGGGAQRGRRGRS